MQTSAYMHAGICAHILLRTHIHTYTRAHANIHTRNVDTDEEALKPGRAHILAYEPHSSLPVGELHGAY